MSHQHLDGPHVLTGFKHMGGKAVSQGMDTFSPFNLSPLLGSVVDLLGSTDVHGPGGIL